MNNKHLNIILGLFAGLILLLSSCNNTTERKDNDQNEKKMQEQELRLKEEELKLREQELENLKSKKEENNYNLADIYKVVKSSILLVVTENESNYSLGSAFIISSDGITLTNYHILSDAYNVVLINEKEEVFHIDEVLDANENLDYVIFRIKTSRSLPYLEIADKTAEIGDECFAIGNPQGLQQTLSKGIISSYRNDNRIIQTTAEITHGSSGGALFNRYGKVIGMTTSGMGEANLNFAINIDAIPYKLYFNKTDTKNNNLLNIKDKDVKQNIKKLINDYYFYTERNKYSELENLFDTNLVRYFGKYRVHKDEVIEGIKNYDKQFGVISKEAKVRWDTFEVKKLDDGNYEVYFILDYSLDRINKDKASYFVIGTNIGITKDYKICSMYEKIISKQ